jgi:hypothetical protein
MPSIENALRPQGHSAFSLQAARQTGNDIAFHGKECLSMSDIIPSPHFTV